MKEIKFRDKNHFVDYKQKRFRVGMNVSQGEYAEAGNWTPCNSTTCKRQKCRDGYIHYLFEPALRFKARNSELRMLTVSKMEAGDLDRFSRKMRDALRKQGYGCETISAIEPHQQGLHHLHQLLETTADDATISQIAAELLGLGTVDVRTGELAGDVAATEWTEIAITPIHPGGATYPFKNLRKGLGKAHLALNNGKAYNLKTNGFFKEVGGMEEAAAAERDLNQIYNEHLVPLLGEERASELSDTTRNATEMMKHWRDHFYNKVMALKKAYSHPAAQGFFNEQVEVFDEVLHNLQHMTETQPQDNSPLTL